MAGSLPHLQSFPSEPLGAAITGDFGFFQKAPLPTKKNTDPPLLAQIQILFFCVPPSIQRPADDRSDVTHGKLIRWKFF